MSIEVERPPPCCEGSGWVAFGRYLRRRDRRTMQRFRCRGCGATRAIPAFVAPASRSGEHWPPMKAAFAAELAGELVERQLADAIRDLCEREKQPYVRVSCWRWLKQIAHAPGLPSKPPGMSSEELRLVAEVARQHYGPQVEAAEDWLSPDLQLRRRPAFAAAFVMAASVAYLCGNLEFDAEAPVRRWHGPRSRLNFPRNFHWKCREAGVPEPWADPETRERICRSFKPGSRDDSARAAGELIRAAGVRSEKHVLTIWDAFHRELVVAEFAPRFLHPHNRRFVAKSFRAGGLLRLIDDDHVRLRNIEGETELVLVERGKVIGRARLPERDEQLFLPVGDCAAELSSNLEASVAERWVPKMIAGHEFEVRRRRGSRVHPAYREANRAGGQARTYTSDPGARTGQFELPLGDLRIRPALRCTGSVSHHSRPEETYRAPGPGGAAGGARLAGNPG